MAVTPYERARHDLVGRLRRGETADLEARCDASGVPIEEVRSAAGLASVPRVDAKGRPRDQLAHGERLVQTGGAHLACGNCDAEACECRRLDSNDVPQPRAKIRSRSAPARVDATDPNLSGGLFTFGSEDSNFAKARAWIGADRCRTDYD